MSQQYVPEENEREALPENAERTEAALAEYRSRCFELQSNLEQVKWERNAVQKAYNEVTGSAAWRLTAPLRKLADIAKALSPARICKQLSHAVTRFWAAFRAHGSAYVWKRVQEILWSRRQLRENQRGLYPKRVLQEQRKAHFPREVRFSILVPLYNTPEHYLKEMIRSVQAQTYPNWELCLADGSDEVYSAVGQICAQFAQKDKRIRYQKLERNLGISGNTNACLRMATGDYIALFDHDDYLCPAALYEVMKAICEKDADFIYTDEAKFSTDIRKTVDPHFKPDFAPDTLRANNYICHFTVFSKALSDSVGGFRPECDGAQDFDMILRLTERAKTIAHIPKVLYLWRVHKGSTAQATEAKSYVTAAGCRAVEAHLERIGLPGKVTAVAASSVYRVHYPIQGNPLVSILIPNYEHIDDLRKCLTSIYQKSNYRNFEVIIIENNSRSPETFSFYREAEKKYENLRVITWEREFNYSAINNFGAKHAKGEYLLLLNNDTEVISPDWIQEMLMFAQRPDVGAVGAKLYYPDNTVQHGGVTVGLGGVAAHSHKGFDRFHPGYMRRLSYAQNVGAVTAACSLIPRRVWNEIGGLDEGYQVAFNDVDMCMRIRQRGYLIVWTPFAELYHYESKSRGADETPESSARFAGEMHRFQTRWAAELAAGDPYYNPNLSLEHEDFRLKRPDEYL